MAQHCNHDGDEIDLEHELRVGRRALDVDSDPAHCRYHLAGALFVAPNDPRVLDLFRCWRGERDTSLDAALDAADQWAGELLLAARIQGESGGAGQAIVLVLKALASGAAPEAVFWLNEWVRDPAVVCALQPDQLTPWLRRIQDDEELDQATLLPMLDDWLDLMDPWLRWCGPDLNVRVRGKRLAGRNRQALALALEFDSSDCSYASAVSVAMCHKELGAVDAAIEWLKLAAERQPDDGFVWLDIGDLAFDECRWAEAIAAYGMALQLQAKPGWAAPSRAAAMYLTQPSPQHRAEFEAAAESAGANARRVKFLRAQSDCWLKHIPYPDEACLNVLPQLIETGGSARMASSSPEAPCAQFLLQQQLAQHNMQLSMSFSVPTPDPRLGLTELAPLLFVDTLVEPQYPAPLTPEAANVAAQLARQPFSPNDWLALARQFQQSAPRSALEWVACMPWPAPAPEGFDALLWFKSHVTACTFLIGAAPVEGPANLWKLIEAPLDWPGEAALLCLGALAVEDAAVLSQLTTRTGPLQARIPNAGNALQRGARGLQLWLGEHGLPIPQPVWWPE